MTPAEIAKKLTPAQVRALRGRSGNRFPYRVSTLTTGVLLTLGLLEGQRLSALGRAVLAELDKGETNGSR